MLYTEITVDNQGFVTFHNGAEFHGTWNWSPAQEGLTHAETTRPTGWEDWENHEVWIDTRTGEERHFHVISRMGMLTIGASPKSKPSE